MHLQMQQWESKSASNTSIEAMQRDHNTRNELTNSKVLQFRPQPDDEAQRLSKCLTNLCNSKARLAYPRHQSTRMTCKYISAIRNRISMLKLGRVHDEINLLGLFC
jgi:hypothetical protein